MLLGCQKPRRMENGLLLIKFQKKHHWSNKPDQKKRQLRTLTLNLKKKMKECGVIKKYSDLYSLEKINESKFNKFVELLKKKD